MPEFVIEVSQDGRQAGYVGPPEGGFRLQEPGAEFTGTVSLPTVATIREAWRLGDLIGAENTAKSLRRKTGASFVYRLVEVE